MNILIVDDEKNQREALAGFVQDVGHTPYTAESAQKALNFLYSNPVDVVLTDYKMPYMTGSDLLNEISSRHPSIVVILMTAFGTIDIAVKAMRDGAWDFLTKPVNLTTLEDQLHAIEKYLGQKRKSDSGEYEDDTGTAGEGFIVHDPEMKRLFQQIRKIANSKATVLITGDTGTGKEVFAHRIHQESNRNSNPMVVVNCAALPSNLIESELFGHVKGAFTGADSDRKGRFEKANQSTLFLDEIGDLPLQMQVKLLRFLQDGIFEKVGSNIPIESDVRIVAATNIDLDHAVEKGEFREDLLYRLNVIHIKIPPLKNRKDDIEPLAHYFLETVCDRDNLGKMHFSSETLETLKDYAFPGNIRELKNIIERAALLAEKTTINKADLNLSISENGYFSAGSLNQAVTELERDMILNEITKTNGNQSACARNLGISERVLRYKLAKYDLK